MQGTLFVVATPLGNLEDMSTRAIRVLGAVEIVACEDTRHTRRLLTHFQIDTRTLSYHEHNEEGRCPELIRYLQEGKDLALVSDAGTPQISDPGFRLVRACRERGLLVLAVPGPSAATAALSVSGLPPDRFLFVGFLPKKRPSRHKAIERLKAVSVSLIFFIPPHGLIDQLTDLKEILGDRQGFLAKEMTKIHERHWWDNLSEIIQNQGTTAKGEYTLVVEGAEGEVGVELNLDLRAYVQGLQALRGLTRKEAIRQAARDLGKSRNEIYRQVAVK